MGDLKQEMINLEIINKAVEGQLNDNRWQVLKRNGNWYPIGFARDCVKRALENVQANESKLPIPDVMHRLNSSDAAPFKQQVRPIFRNGEFVGNLLMHRLAKFTEEEYDDLVNSIVNDA